MNFPMDEPLFQFFYWLVNTPGIGAAVIGLLVGAAVTVFFLTLRWIVSAKNESEEGLSFPPSH
ncbi:MAG: hypothetical protein HY867_21050 [Chloroflexi bacterium]|nr:hypothetical protein [Chloroflexota bacterium]